MKNHKYSLAAIIILAFVVRFWNLNTFPALNADEAALGYNAWSLLETGMDEHGNSWPIHFQSFNDFKPGLMVYLILPFVKVLGLTAWAVRIPGALAGVGTVFIVYRLIIDGQLLMVSSEDKTFQKDSIMKNQRLAIIASLFLAISPWHIHFSRGGWEVNVATFFMTAGVWLFLRSVRHKVDSAGSDPAAQSLTLVVSAVSFALSLYTYHSARLVVPLLGIGFAVLYWRELWSRLISVIGALLVFGIMIMPLMIDLTTDAGFSRAAGVGIFADSGPLSEINEQRGEHAQLDSLESKLLHNKPLNYSLAIAENWTEHYSGEFLFLSGDDIQRNRVPEHGQMYMFDVVVVIIGLFVVRKARHHKVILLWLLVAPSAASLTFQSPHALRAQNMVIPLVIIAAFGFVEIVDKSKEKISIFSLRTTFNVLLITLLVWGFARYQQLYWNHMPREYPFSSQYGVAELMDYVVENQEKYEKIIITDRYDQPYILALFYLKYPPDIFQSEHVLTARDGFGFSTVRDFGKQSLQDGQTSYKFTFVSLSEWSDIASSNPNTLIAGTDKEIPDAANIVKTIYFPNGDIAFQVVAN